MERNFKIDVVVPWVDGSDANWKKKKSKYVHKAHEAENGEERFRDFGTLKLFFDGMTNYAPWVNKIYVVTDNQRPNFKITDNRVVFINHEDYIPQMYLPTFNSNTIEMNFDLIAGLSEHFIIFNDDTILMNPIKSTDFFTEEGVAKDFGAFRMVRPIEQFSHVVMNNLILINQVVSKRDHVKSNFFKYFNIKYGFKGMIGLLTLPDPYWLGWVDPHLPMPYTKELFKKVYDLFPTLREEQSERKFRTIEDVSHWIFRYYRLATGEFSPQNSGNLGVFSALNPDGKLEEVKKALSKNKKILLINDVPMTNEQAMEVQKNLNRIFELHNSREF
ncbi:stealth family protein [Weissella cibaria]|uniref:stealth family protein n=1 Tax=Weissella cibaria TaxID=137591 RepID=UPI00223BC445|nr:stealth family protein [Weissella cibaria]MCT0021420.1 capsule biosynthesis protein CapG [Weissella cibaria]